ncbi:hypothetical protein [Ekhidna sp.]|uniref:hypothetical protein n=1 Tax=Ekhidna sp. TaxID=2608089 RepID=UPI003C7C3357
MKTGFDDRDFKKALNVLDKLQLSDKDLNRAASKALIPGVHEVRAGIKAFKGSTSKDGISKALLLARMVRRKMSRKGYLPGARIVIDGPDIPMGDRDWSAQGVAKLYQKDDTGQRTTRGTGANRGAFQGKSVGGGDNYIARFADKAKTTIKASFEQAAKKLMRDQIKKAIR